MSFIIPLDIFEAKIGQLITSQSTLEFSWALEQRQYKKLELFLTEWSRSYIVVALISMHRFSKINLSKSYEDWFSSEYPTNFCSNVVKRSVIDEAKILFAVVFRLSKF